MYTKAEAARLRQAFWTAFGLYMAPVPGAEGEPVNWINYRTGVKHLAFRLDADQRRATIAIELTHPDPATRQVFYDQLVALKGLLREALGEDWRWEADTTNEHGQPLSRVGQELAPANVFERDDWPALISFFKPRLMALDAFWSEARYGFEALG